MPNDLSRRRALALGAAGLGFGRIARAAAVYPRTWTFGDVTVTKVVEMHMPFPAARAFPGAPLEAFDENANWLVPHFYDPATKDILFSYHAFVVRTPRMVVVMDCGYGDDKPVTTQLPGARKESFLDNWRATGAAFEQVTYVMNSHFHSDHVGWNTRRDGDKWVPMFPRARYLFNRKEYAYAEAGAATSAGVGASFGAGVKPIMDAGAADLIDGDRDLGDGLRIVAMPGHTPGHHGLAIDSKGKRAILCGDAIHNPIEVLHPEWTVWFDHDKDAGRAQRMKLVDECTDVDVTVLTAHFDGPTAGKIISERGGKRRFKTLVA